MGNDNSKATANAMAIHQHDNDYSQDSVIFMLVPRQPLGMVAMAHYMKLSKEQIMELRDSCAPLASWNQTISRKFFHIAVAKAKIPEQVNGYIFDLLFTMWDLNGADRVPFKEFVVGASPLACRNESLASVLLFALQVMDLTQFGRIDAQGLQEVLESINATASYFESDPVLRSKHIKKLVAHVFSGRQEYISNKDCVERLIQHPLMLQFVDQDNKPQVKFKEQLEETSSMAT